MAYIENLISESLKAGHSIDSIVNDLHKSDDPEEKAWATKWMETASKPEYAPGAGSKKQDNITPMLDFAKENPKETAALAVAAYAATKLPKAIAWYEDRKIKKEELAIKRLSAESYAKQVAAQPLQAVEDLTHADVANMVKAERNVTGKPNPLAASFEEKFKMPLAEAEQLSGGKITNPVDAEIVGNALTKGQGFSVNPMRGSVGNAPAGIPSAVNPINQFIPPAAPQPPVGAVAPETVAPQAVAPQPPTTLKEAVETGGDVSKTLKADVAGMVDEAAPKPVYPKGESLKAVPPGFVFRKDVGNLDRSLGNILGKEHREYARELFNEGKPFGHSPNLNDDVSKLTNQYFQHLQSQVPETILDRAARRAQNIPSEFGTFAKNTNFGQKAKIGGVTGTLFALADLANASQPSSGNAVVPPQTSEGGAAFGGFTSGKKYQAAKKRAEQADVNTLADPKTYASVQSFLGVPPDQLGFSVMHPEYKKIREVADPAYMASLLAALSPRGLSKMFGK